MAAPREASIATAVTKLLPRRLPNSPVSRKPANRRRGMSQRLLSMYPEDEGGGQKARGTNGGALGPYDVIPFCLLVSAFLLCSSPGICRWGGRPRMSSDLFPVPGSHRGRPKAEGRRGGRGGGGAPLDSKIRA